MYRVQFRAGIAVPGQGPVRTPACGIRGANARVKESVIPAMRNHKHAVDAESKHGVALVAVNGVLGVTAYWAAPALQVWSRTPTKHAVSAERKTETAHVTKAACGTHGLFGTTVVMRANASQGSRVPKRLHAAIAAVKTEVVYAPEIVPGLTGDLGARATLKGSVPSETQKVRFKHVAIAVQKLEAVSVPTHVPGKPGRIGVIVPVRVNVRR